MAAATTTTTHQLRPGRAEQPENPDRTRQRPRQRPGSRTTLAWKRRSCGDGVRSPRVYDWAVATLPDAGTAEHGHTRWLLIRRSVTKPTELAYYLCYGPADTGDEELIRGAGTRWAIEECFQTSKNELGLSGSPGASLRRGPLRTGRARFPGIRLK
ncbi:hypothetical protein ABZS66_55990 [Dactylosporangium sp. NPDC005572]|uniref:hypothetical protein n=1 Tax=Dactylosporangium sp. NPDC005572 TaxID=3156889 RepID=UPI0033B8A892